MVSNDICNYTIIKIMYHALKGGIDSGSGSGLYSGGLTWSIDCIVLSLLR